MTTPKPSQHATWPDIGVRRNRHGHVKEGTPHRRAWNAARFQPYCCYCELPFARELLPTFDHIVPVSLGGNLSTDGWVLSCSPCNQARGDAPYEEYLAAVLIERALAASTKRPYRRPKRRHLPDGGYVITTKSKAQLRNTQP